MKTLEEQLEEAFSELAISDNNKISITSYLTILKEKDLPTYEHCIRVGLLGGKIAKHLNLDPKAMFFAGALHDIGKILIEPEVLKKTSGFDEEDARKMQKHPEYSYSLLHGVHEFSAEIAVRHHMYQENSYPAELPAPKIPFSDKTKALIEAYARLLAILDSYDAITTRHNDRFGTEKLAKRRIKEILLQKNPDKNELILELYSQKIFREE